MPGETVAGCNRPSARALQHANHSQKDSFMRHAGRPHGLMHLVPGMCSCTGAISQPSHCLCQVPHTCLSIWVGRILAVRRANPQQAAYIKRTNSARQSVNPEHAEFRSCLTSSNFAFGSRPGWDISNTCHEQRQRLHELQYT